MSSGLKKTFEVLTTSRNEASLPLLLSAFESAEPGIFDRALQALVSRRYRTGHSAVIARWHELNDAQREMVDQGRGKMNTALRDALLSDDEQQFRNACEIMVRFHEFDMVTALVNLAEDKSRKHSAEATTLVLEMVNLLSELVHGRRDAADRRDPMLLRSRVMEGLERSVERYRTHQCDELIEAFVILGGTTCNLLRNIIDDPHHACYMTVVHTLSTSQSVGVLELLLSFLSLDHPSLATLTVVSRRSDETFLRKLFDFLNGDLPGKVKRNLSRIKSIPWIEDKSFSFSAMPPADQSSCVHLVAASGTNADKKLDILEKVLKHGACEGRVAACEALADIPGDRSNQLILDYARDNDPQVQAAIARQLRQRHIAGTMAILVEQLDSPHEIVREATREALSEFTLENYLTQFDTLHDDSRKTTGGLVKKVDVNLVPKLLAEFESPARRNRLRAIEVTDALGVQQETCDGLISLLDDSDHIVRAAAAESLQHCPSERALHALQYAAADRSSAVQSAAKGSLAVLGTANLSLGTSLPAENQL